MQRKDIRMQNTDSDWIETPAILIEATGNICG